MNRPYPRVLIVDDDEAMAQVLRRVFDIWHWDTRKALDCATALAFLESEERFDLILLDLVLPDCHGIEVMRWIREHDYPITAIVMTGKTPDQCNDVANLKPRVLVQKPWHFEPIRSLAEEIYKRFFDERQARAQGPAAPATTAAPAVDRESDCD